MAADYLVSSLQPLVMAGGGDYDVVFCEFRDIGCLEDGLFKEVDIDILFGADGKDVGG